jgi:hypothetical protein
MAHAIIQKSFPVIPAESQSLEASEQLAWILIRAF